MVKRNLIPMVIGFFLLFYTACAGHRPPTEATMEAHEAFQKAIEAQAEIYATRKFEQGEEHLVAAQREIEKEQYEVARVLAGEAKRTFNEAAAIATKRSAEIEEERRKREEEEKRKIEAEKERIKRQEQERRLAKLQAEEERRKAPLTHKVKPGESLWIIAASKKYYNDPYLWPLIYKTNRDQIRDPDLIYPDQILKISLAYPPSEIEKARQETGAPR